MDCTSGFINFFDSNIDHEIFKTQKIQRSCMREWYPLTQLLLTTTKKGGEFRQQHLSKRVESVN